MRIYHPTGRGHTLYVSPAADPRNGGVVDSEWLHDDGTPKMIEVSFRDGKAEVPDALGRYLVATRQATRLFLPKFLAA